MHKAKPETRSTYRWFREISTQWKDNDIYGHVNNAVHYTWFDTTVNGWLIEAGFLEIGRSQIVGLVVSTACQFFGEVKFPDRVTCGLRVARIGNTSVAYELGLFRNDAPTAFAQGSFIHVYVDINTRRPALINDQLKASLEMLHVRSASQWA